MKKSLHLIAALGLTLPASADVILQYRTAPGSPLAPFASASEVTPTDLVAGSGLTVASGGTFNFNNWDIASTSFAEAVAANDKWTWGFTVDSAGVNLTTMDVRLDRSGSGPDDFEIQAVVTPSGGIAGAPITVLTHDYLDSGSGVNFVDVDLSAIPSLAVGDSIEFTLAAFNSESSGGTFDLETITFPGGNDSLVINGDIAGALPDLSLLLDRTVAFENEAGGGVFLAIVSRSGDTTDPLTVTVTNPDPTELDVPATVEFFAGETDSFLFFDVKDDGDMDGGQVVTLDLTAPGFNPASIDITVLDDDSTTEDVVLNEALINTTGSDTEFLELYNNTAGTVDLQGWSIVSYDSDSGEEGAVLTTVEIPSGAAVDLLTSDFYLIGDNAFVAAFTTVTPDLLVPAVGTPGGSQTLAVFDAAGNLVYTVLFDDGDGSANIGGAPITPDLSVGPDGTFLPPGFRFVADGGGFAELLEFSPTPSPTATPGVTNALTPELLLSFDKDFVAEDAGTMAAVGTVTRRFADPGSPLTVTLTEDDADDSEISIPTSVTILAGETTATFDVGALTDGTNDGVQNITVTATDGGGTYSAAMGTIGVTDIDAVQFTDVVINEVDSDQALSDTAEFIELYNTSGTAGSLDGLVLVLFNGSDDASYRAIDLTGQTIPANGYFVIGNALTVANVDLDFVTDLGLPDNNNFQNGADAVALFVATSGDFPNDTPAATAVANFTLLDVVVYDTNDGDDTGLLTAFGLTEQINEGGAGSKDTDSISRSVDGSGGFVPVPPTPGLANVVPDPVDPVITGISYDSVSGAITIDFTGESGFAYTLTSDTAEDGSFATTVTTTGGSTTPDGGGVGQVSFAYGGGTLLFRLEE